jgi:hypothetical protein
MAKVKFKFDPRTPKKTKEAILRIVNDAILKNKINETLVTQVQTQQRAFDDKKLKALKRSSIAHRRYLSNFNATSDQYSARRSNLTFTGQLLKSYKTKISKSGVVTIGPTGTHKGYRTGGGRGRSIANSKIVRFQARQGRDLTRLGQKTLRKLTNVIVTFVRGKLRR